MDKDKLIHILKSEHCFSSLTDEELKTLSGYCSVVSFASGEYLSHEGDTTRDLYVLIEGAVELDKFDKTENKRITFGKIKPDNTSPYPLIGEISFFDGMPRSCDVRFVENSTLIKLSAEALNLHDSFSRHLIECGLRWLNTRLRDTTGSLSSSLKEQILLIQEKIKISRFFTAIICFLFITIAVNSFLLKNFSINTYSPSFTLSYSIMLVLPVSIAAYYNGYPLTMFGITRINVKRSLIESVILSIVLCIALLSWTMFKRRIDIKQAYLLFDPNHNYYIMFFSYFFLVVGQQLFRCLTQEVLMRLYEKNRVVLSIFVSSLFFGFVHAHISLFAVILCFLAGILFGIIYYRHRNLYGLVIIHFSLGFLIFSMNIL